LYFIRRAVTLHWPNPIRSEVPKVRIYLLRAVAAALLLIPLLSAGATAKTWTGAAGPYWSSSGNWNPQAIPAAGEPLIFPTGSATVNDLPSGTAIGALTYQGGSANLTGNSLTLMGDVSFDVNNSLTFVCNAPLKIGAPLSVNAGWNNTYYSIDVNGQTLTFNNAHPIVVKVLNGSGTVNANGLGVQLDNDGTFSGTLTGTWNVVGSLPNANVNATTLTGSGTVGNVVVAYLRPGWNNPGGADLHNGGPIRTKSLTITQQYGVDLTALNIDQALVTGTVTLTGASLALSLPSAYPPAGTPITIISNDGNDPVVGTFTGLPEGGTLTVNGIVFTISYHGGDGNDVTLTAGSTVKSWTGLNHAAWSSAYNWAPQAIPVAGEPLVFSIGTATMVNDLPAGFTVGSMAFKGGWVELDGNALTLTGDVTFGSLVSNFSCFAPLKIGNALTLGATPNTMYSAIDVNGKTLTINTSPTVLWVLSGSGTIELTGPGARIDRNGTFTGVIHGSIDFSATSLPNADITAPFMTGNGTAGKVVGATLRPGWGGAAPSGPDTHATGILHTKSLTLAGGSLDVDLVPGSDSDLVQVTGPVSLSGALKVSLPGTTPAFGQAFVILDNDGTDPINGTFTNLPEGSAVHSGNYVFRLSYTGGDGNDVELVTAAQPVITLTHARTSTVVGERVMFTASITTGFASPLGSLTFAADGLPIGTVPIVNGSASIEVSSLPIGDRMITASFVGGGAFVAAVSAPLTHTVHRGATTTTLEALDPLVYGASRFRVTTVVNAPAVTPLSGSVTLRENGIVVGTANLSGSTAMVDTPSLHPGLHILIASYDGSSTLLTSDSHTLTASIAPADTHLVVSHQETPSAADGNVRLTVLVSSGSGVPAVPTGTVTIAESGNPITHASINGATSLMLTLTPGAHLLTVSYSGDANFAGDTTTYTVTFGSPAPPSRHRGVRH
jgi:Big-like domain-containing protein